MGGRRGKKRNLLLFIKREGVSKEGRRRITSSAREVPAWPLAQDYGRVAKTWLDSDHEKERGRGRADAGSLSKREEPVAPEPSVDYDSNDHGTGPKGKKKGLSRTSFFSHFAFESTHFFR